MSKIFWVIDFLIANLEMIGVGVVAALIVHGFLTALTSTGRMARLVAAFLVATLLVGLIGDPFARNYRILQLLRHGEGHGGLLTEYSRKQAKHELMGLRKRVLEDLKTRDAFVLYGAWTIADILASFPRRELILAGFGELDRHLLELSKASRGCWADTQQALEEEGLCETPSTAWSMLGLSRFGSSIPDETWDFLLQEQSRDGSWAVFEGTGNCESCSGNASSQATGLVHLALAETLQMDLVPDSKREAVRAALETSRRWLTANLSENCEMKDYPNVADAKVMRGLSGLTVTAISRAPELFGPVDPDLKGRCLDYLRRSLERDSSPGLMQASSRYILLPGRAPANDSKKHMSTLWTVFGIRSALGPGQFQRAETMLLLEQTLFGNEHAMTDDLRHTWQAAKFGFLMRTLLHQPLDNGRLFDKEVDTSRADIASRDDGSSGAESIWQGTG